MITLYTSTTAEDGTALFAISIVCISFASIIVFGLSIYNFCRKIGEFKSLESIIKEDLDMEFEQLNSTYANKLRFSYDEKNKEIQIKVLNLKKIN